MSDNNTTNDVESGESDAESVSIQIDFLATAQTKDMATAEKVRKIIDSVKDNNVVVLEEGLTPDEEGTLVEMTMQQIGPEKDFSGLEIERYHSPKEKSGFLSRMLSGDDQKSSLTIVGPANKVQTIENEEMMQAIISK